MKKTVLMLAALVLGSMAFAQNADKKEAVDQYGNTVDVKTLQSSSRDGILVFESKEKDYKFWFDARVQVDFGHYFGAQEWADPIGSGAAFVVHALLPRLKSHLIGMVRSTWNSPTVPSS